MRPLDGTTGFEAEHGTGAGGVKERMGNKPGDIRTTPAASNLGAESQTLPKRIGTKPGPKTGTRIGLKIGEG